MAKLTPQQKYYRKIQRRHRIETIKEYYKINKDVIDKALNKERSYNDVVMKKTNYQQFKALVMGPLKTKQAKNVRSAIHQITRTSLFKENIMAENFKRGLMKSKDFRKLFKKTTGKALSSVNPNSFKYAGSRNTYYYNDDEDDDVVYKIEIEQSPKTGIFIIWLETYVEGKLVKRECIGKY